MTELAVICVILAISIPVTVAISGFFQKTVAKNAFDHIQKTSTIGGTPREVFLQKADLDVERKRADLEAKKPRPVNPRGTVY